MTSMVSRAARVGVAALLGLSVLGTMQVATAQGWRERQYWQYQQEQRERELARERWWREHQREREMERQRAEWLREHRWSNWNDWRGADEPNTGCPKYC